MRLHIDVRLDYRLPGPTDLLLQLEAAHLPEQSVDDAELVLSAHDHFARVAGHDAIGQRVWVRASDRLTAEYRATVAINRILNDCSALTAVPPHKLPGETVEYLLPSRYCPSDRFQTFVEAEFAGLQGGTAVTAMRDWIGRHLRYVPGSSNADTTAADTFIARRGICRDYAHLLITLARAGGVPARIASVYAPGVDPPDFHAVAEVFVGGEWHLMDATAMAEEGSMAKIGVGRDAGDVAFLTAFGTVEMLEQRVQVVAACAT
jgi:transglutaminase-like putative cysteine protease